MSLELSGSTLRHTYTPKQQPEGEGDGGATGDGRGERDGGENAMSLSPADEQLHMLTHVLQSHEQAVLSGGPAGPASNLLSQMNVSLPLPPPIQSNTHPATD